MAIDNTKRTTLKYLAIGSGAMVAPGLAAAVGTHGTTYDYAESAPINGTGLAISFSDKPNADGSREIVVTNTNDQAVTLKRVYPSIVSTTDGQYDLNSLLVNGSRQFAPKQETKLNIQVAHRDAHKRVRPPLRTATATIKVQTRSANINGGSPTATTRLMFS